MKVRIQRNHKLFWGKCARNKKIDMKWIEIAYRYCTFSSISSLEWKRSNIQSKIWNCPPQPLFYSTVTTERTLSACLPLRSQCAGWTREGKLAFSCEIEASKVTLFGQSFSFKRSQRGCRNRPSVRCQNKKITTETKLTREFGSLCLINRQEFQYIK